MTRRLSPRPLAPTLGPSLLGGCGSTVQQTSEVAADGTGTLGGASAGLPVEQGVPVEQGLPVEQGVPVEALA